MRHRQQSSDVSFAVLGRERKHTIVKRSDRDCFFGEIAPEAFGPPEESGDSETWRAPSLASSEV